MTKIERLMMMWVALIMAAAAQLLGQQRAWVAMTLAALIALSAGYAAVTTVPERRGRSRKVKIRRRRSRR